MNNINIFNNINNIQINQFSNSLNLKVEQYEDFDNEMIDFGISIINKAYSIMNKYDDITKYVSNSFDSKYPEKTHWNCFIWPKGNDRCFYWSKKRIWCTTDIDTILIFLAG